jgi:hypothetical protein
MSDESAKIFVLLLSLIREAPSKSKAVPLHAMEALVGRRYGSYSFLTAALDGVSGQRQAQTAILARGKETPGTHWI